MTYRSEAIVIESSAAGENSTYRRLGQGSALSGGSGAAIQIENVYKKESSSRSSSASSELRD
jgi:hypothetical protein